MHIRYSTSAMLKCFCRCTFVVGMVGVVFRAQAEVREVPVSEVVREFCAVVVSNEARYMETLKRCFPDTSHDDEVPSRCQAASNSIISIMDEFFALWNSDEVEAHYYERPGWKPRGDLFEELQCKRRDILDWHCPGLSKEQVRIANREPVCADAFAVEDRIADVTKNLQRAFQLLELRRLREIPTELGPVAPR